MSQSKRNQLRKLGYRMTNTKEFLGLSNEEMALIDLKVSRIKRLKDTRTRKSSSAFDSLR